MDLRVRGVEQFAELSKRLRGADKEIKREFYRGLNRTVKPLTKDVKESTGDFLPGRYAGELSASLKVKTRRRASGRNPAISLVGTAKTKRGKSRDLASLNRGRLRHPLFGNRRFWYDQRVRKDWWTHPLLQGAPKVRKELIKVMDDIARRLAK